MKLSKRTERKHVRALEPFGRHVHEMYVTLTDMSDKDLRYVRKSIDSITVANCWWATFQATPLLKNIVDAELKIRKQRKKKGLPLIKVFDPFDL